MYLIGENAKGLGKERQGKVARSVFLNLQRTHKKILMLNVTIINYLCMYVCILNAKAHKYKILFLQALSRLLTLETPSIKNIYVLLKKMFFFFPL